MSIIRDITLLAQKDLMAPEIQLFIGSRQAGKTTILKQLQRKIETEGFRSHFLNLEDPDYLTLLDQSPKNLAKIFTLNSKKKIFVFIDEIQYLKNPTNFLKYWHDEAQNSLKLIVSGSSAFYIDQKFKDSLVGRKKIYPVRTLSFREFLRFKNEENFMERLPSHFRPDHQTLKQKWALHDYERLNRYFDEFLIFGGYPRVVLAETPEEKELVLQDIGYSYVKKDIYENGVRQEEVFFKLIKILAAQAGKLVNASELAGTLGVSKTAIDHYLYIAEKSYHITLLRPFFKNLRKELTKMPKVFFNDTGLRNFFVGNFEVPFRRTDKGEILENAVFRQLLDHFDTETIQFWRTPQGHEVDFIVDGKRAFEVKYEERSIDRKKYDYFKKQHPGILLEFVVYNKKNSKIKDLWEAWEI